MELALAVTAIALFLCMAGTDILRRRIPNRFVAMLVVVGLARLGAELAAGDPLWNASADVALALVVFALGAVLFRFGLLGGGDVKLLAAGALWLGVGSAWPYLAGTALAGGVLATGFVIWTMFVGRGRRRPDLPYGVAIAAGGVLGTLGGL